VSNSELPSDDPASVSTFTVFSCVLTALAWEAEIVVLLIHFFAHQPLPPLAHGALVLVASSLTLFVALRGRSEIQKLQVPMGRIRVTRGQSIMVTFLMVTFGCFLSVIGIVLFG
jgi:hypothetical protein